MLFEQLDVSNFGKVSLRRGGRRACLLEGGHRPFLNISGPQRMRSIDRSKDRCRAQTIDKCEPLASVILQL